MSFLDNLENNLKNLESQEDAQANAEAQRKARDRERSAAQAAAPHAEELRKGRYTQELLRQTARVGYSMRTKVHIAWLGNTLRLEARERRLELRPTARGIVAAYLEDGNVREEPLDLNGSPEELLRNWLAA
jgi:hypothetical protein